MNQIKTVSLIGLGAMGSFFAPKLIALLGDNFRVIADGKRRERLLNSGVTINGVCYKPNTVTPDTHGDPADLIIIAVKGYSLDSAIADIKNQVGPNTLILPVLNGVESEEKLISAFSEANVLYAYMRVSIVMNNNTANYDPSIGSVHFGDRFNRRDALSERVQIIADLFDRACIAYEIDEDMLKGIWFKYACNIGENMTCALLGVPFGAFQVSENANIIRRAAMREIIAIAQKKGIALGEAEIAVQEVAVKKIPYQNKPSTLQDIEGRKHTEVDMFAGTAVRLGAECGVPTPICTMFLHAIRVLEEKNDRLI